MSNTKETTVRVGPGFTGLLTLLFITLKLTGVIAWSWLWVLSPLWIGFAIFVSIVLFALVLAGFTLLVASVLNKWKR